ncbi:MAG: alpha/beta fold hydrolase [Janthinobacterium lividum]
MSSSARHLPDSASAHASKHAIETRVFTGVSGNRLVADAGGDPAAPAVLLLHGGGQTRHSWGQAQRELIDAGYYAVSLDSRGHGESDWIASGDYALDRLVEDVRAVVAQMGTASGRRPALVGASLGGVSALIACGRDPALASALVLVDVAPRLRADGVAHIHRFMGANPDGFASLEEASDAIARYNPLRPRARNVDGLRKNLRQHDNGRWYWHWDPKMFGTDYEAKLAVMSAQMIDAAQRVTIPVMLLRGRQSDVLGEEGVEELRQHIPHLEFVDIEGAGHMIAGDRNDHFNAAVADFLKRHLATA